jgi:hypothetical protein
MWEENYFKLFISHVSHQKEVAHGIKEALKNHHVSCFVAHDDIEPTRQWQDDIEEALRSMDALAAVLTPGFHESKWTDQEVGYAMGSGRLILPIRHGADPHGFIGKYQGYTIKAGTPYYTIAAEIVAILARHSVTSHRLACALVHKFEQSWSWDSAKSTMSMLEECPVIPDDLLTRIEAAKDSNREVGSAWGVPERIIALVQKRRQIGEAEQDEPQQPPLAALSAMSPVS